MLASKVSGKMRGLFASRYAFPFLAFIVPLLLRIVPEVLMGSYAVGFDTMGYYVPTTLLWLRGDVSFLSFIGTAPLFYSIVISLVSLGGSVVLVLKVVSVVLEGLLGLSIFGFAQKGLGWSPRKSVAVAFLGTLYFVALRISWDSLRNMLGLVFFFVALMIFSMGERNGFSWKKYVLLSLSMLAVVLSHQLVSVIMLGAFGYTVGYKLLRRQPANAVRMVLVALPSAVLFLAVVFLLPTVSEFRLIYGFSYISDGWLALFGFSSYPAMLLSEAGFFLFCFLPLLPFLVLGIWRLKNFQLRSWMALSLVLLFIPMISPSNLRWVTMLTYPLAFCVVEAVSRLRYISWRRFGFNLRRIGVVYLVLMLSVLSLGFMLMTPQTPFPYFAEPVNGYVYQVPTSMLLNTLPKVDCGDAVNALQWFKDNVSVSSVLLTHRVFFGWAMLTVNPGQIMLYEYDNPAVAAGNLIQRNHVGIYLIWWVNGTGWYGQPTVSSLFIEVYHSGEIAIYRYGVSS